MSIFGAIGALKGVVDFVEDLVDTANPDTEADSSSASLAAKLAWEGLELTGLDDDVVGAVEDVKKKLFDKNTPADLAESLRNLHEKAGVAMEKAGEIHEDAKGFFAGFKDTIGRLDDGFEKFGDSMQKHWDDFTDHVNEAVAETKDGDGENDGIHGVDDIVGAALGGLGDLADDLGDAAKEAFHHVIHGDDDQEEDVTDVEVLTEDPAPEMETPPADIGAHDEL